MLKNISKLEIEIGGKIYQFLCDCDSSITHVKDALFHFVKYVGQVEDQLKLKKESEENIPEDKQEVS